MAVAIVTYPKFKGWIPASGLPAVGYEVHTFVAGTVNTPLTSYSDPDGTVPNTNPVVLDSVGEANIYVLASAKLVYTIPGGDPGSPIWVVDDYNVQTNESIITGELTASADNKYDYNPTPPFTSIPDRLTLVGTPTASNTDTLAATVFTGTGINDLTFIGPYTGSISGSIFSVEIDDVAVQAPAAPTAVLSGTAGSVTAGDHIVKLTAITATGETTLSPASATVTADGTKKIDVSGIPALAGAITGYKVYMTKAGGATYYYVATVTATTYAINTADAALTVVAPSTNTTGDGTGAADTFKWKKDGGAYTTGVAISLVGANQNLIEGIVVKFAQATGHTLADVWSVTVTTPARLDLSDLGYKIIRKISGGAMVALDGGDLQNGYPATMVYSLGQDCWILNNPSLPVLSTLIPKRARKNITATYQVLAADEGTELSCTGTFTVTLPLCSSVPGSFFYISNVGAGVITISRKAAPDIIILPEIVAGVTSMTLQQSERMAIQLVTNGVDWHLLTQTDTIRNLLITYFTTPGANTWTKTPGKSWAEVDVIGGGAGGESTAPGVAGFGGGAGGRSLKIIDIRAITSETVTVGAAGATSSFGAHCSATGGAGIAGGMGADGDLNIGGAPGQQIDPTWLVAGMGGSTPYGGGGVGGIAGAGSGGAAAGYGAGGGGGYGDVGGAGAPGLVIVREY